MEEAVIPIFRAKRRRLAMGESKGKGASTGEDGKR
jgi:hypothetical protein